MDLVSILERVEGGQADKNIVKHSNNQLENQKLKFFFPPSDLNY